MSTEPPRSRAGFGRLVAVIVAVLAVAAGALVAVAAVTPPRVSSTAVAPEALVTRLGQRVVVTLDQPVAPDGLELTVEPAAPASLTADGSTLTVRFEGMLDYATDYAVRIDGVRSAATGATGRVEVAFTTPDEQILLLVPGADGDRIMSASATAGDPPTERYRAEHISEFVRVGDGLVVISDEGDGPRVRHLTPDGRVFVLGGPADATYRALRASPDGRGYGVVLTSASVGPERTVYDSVLQLVDAATDIETEVTGFDGGPLSVADWTYVRGTTSILVRSLDLQGYIVDPAGGEPVPLGTLGPLRGFVPGTPVLLTDQWPDTFETDLTTAETIRLDAGDVAGDFIPLGAARFAQVVHVFVNDPVARWATSYVVGIGEDGMRELFRPPSGAITGLCASPNAQLLAVTLVDPSSPDQPPLTYLVDARTGATMRTLTGGRPDWCAGG